MNEMIVYGMGAAVQAVVVVRWIRKNEVAATSLAKSEVALGFILACFFAPIVTAVVAWHLFITMIYYLTGGNVTKNRQDKIEKETQAALAKMKVNQ